MPKQADKWQVEGFHSGQQDHGKHEEVELQAT